MDPLKDYLSRRDLVELLALSQKTLQCRTEDQMKDLVLELRKLIGFENACCTQANLPDTYLERDADVDFLDIGYPDGFLDIYFENRYHLIDPFLCSALMLLSPVSIRTVKRNNGNSKTISLASDFNMEDGWAHCTVAPGSLRCTVFFMNGPRPDTTIRAQKIIEYIIPFYSLAYTGVIGKIDRPVHHLTQREIEVIKWIKEGKSSWEISLILNCSKRVIDFHVANIKTKLDSVSRAQCVAKAAHCGIINI